MVGCYRFPKLEGVAATKEGEGPLAAKSFPDDGADWILDEEEIAMVVEPTERDPERHRDEKPEGEEGEQDPLDKEVEALKELASPVEFTSVYLARPMKSRKKKDALRAVQELYVQLRSSGFPAHHSDRARELQTDALESWAAARDIDLKWFS